MTQAIHLFRRGYLPFQRWMEAIAGWIEGRRQRRELLTLSDATLRDLGLTRGDLERVAMGMGWGPLDTADLEATRRHRRLRLGSGEPGQP